MYREMGRSCGKFRLLKREGISGVIAGQDGQ